MKVVMAKAKNSTLEGGLEKKIREADPGAHSNFLLPTVLQTLSPCLLQCSWRSRPRVLHKGIPASLGGVPNPLSPGAVAQTHQLQQAPYPRINSPLLFLFSPPFPFISSHSLLFSTFSKGFSH